MSEPPGQHGGGHRPQERPGHRPAGHAVAGERSGMGDGDHREREKQQRDQPGGERRCQRRHQQDRGQPPRGDPQRGENRALLAPDRDRPVTQRQNQHQITDACWQCRCQDRRRQNDQDQHYLDRERGRADGGTHAVDALPRHSPVRQRSVFWPHVTPSCCSLYSALRIDYGDAHSDTGACDLGIVATAARSPGPPPVLVDAPPRLAPGRDGRRRPCRFAREPPPGSRPTCSFPGAARCSSPAGRGVGSHVPGERGQAGAGRKSLSAWWGREATDGRLERLGGAQAGGVIEMTAHDHEPDR